MRNLTLLVTGAVLTGLALPSSTSDRYTGALVTDDIAPAVFVMAAVPDVVANRAPRVRIHPEEQFFPLSSHTFVDHSDLRWSHNSGCLDHGVDTTPSETSMSGGTTYDHQEASNTWCDHYGTWWQPDDIVAPHQDGGPGGNEGLFLDLENAYRDGQGFGGDEPVYYKFVSGSRIDYWFHWGYSQTLNIGAHEGDWERISVRLNDSNEPQEVQYFQHHTSCTLAWSDAPKYNGHPVLWATKEAHGSYPAGADAHSGDRISGDGPLWNTQGNLDGLGSIDWYGYAGGWGEVGNFADTTGPWGPNPHRGEPGFATPRCDMT